MPPARKLPFPAALLWVLSAVLASSFLSPATARAARLAGEDQPVTTAPAPSPIPPPRPAADRPPGPAKAEATQPAAGVQLTAPRVLPPPPAGVNRAAAVPDTDSSVGTTPAPKAALPAPPGRNRAGAPPASAEEQAVPQKPQTPLRGTPSQGRQYVTIDFDNVDIPVFVKFISELTGKNFVIDEKVKGKVTVISPRKIPVDEVYKVFESVMEIYGFATVQAGEVTKVIPALDARAKDVELRLRKEAISPEDKIVTQILSLQHANPDEMKKVLDPLISKNSIILSYAPTGMLIITDLLSNIRRLQDIVTALDVDGVGEQLSFTPIQAASAPEIVKSLLAIFPPQKAGIAPIKIVADERTNSVILLASEQDTVHVKKLISLMDREIPRNADLLHVYRLQNANAEDLVKVLMNIPKDPKDPKLAGKAPVVSKNVNVVADKATNTLIITADRDDYQILERVIQKLDEMRPMVYIEALIMEVSVTKSFNLGVEWRGIKDTGAISGVDSGQAAAIAGSGGLGTSGAYSIIPSATTTSGVTSTAFPSGFSLGVLGAGITIGGVVFPTIGAVIQAYQRDSEVSILSTPQLLTIDNEDAEINVGKNVPYITRQDTSVTNPGTTYGVSYEYRDVGVVLKITPHINEDKFVRLKIDQQVTKVSGTQTTTPTTLKRTAKTTVVVKDSETIVIGGLIEDTTSRENYQAPCLGDVPVLGLLFKSMSRYRDKNNLFVFITPRIIRNQAEAAAIYRSKLDDIGSVEEGIIKMNEKRTMQKPGSDRKE